MSNREKLTHLQYLALEGEVAFALATSPHNAEMLYRIYLMLKELPRKYRANIIESVKSMISLDEVVIDRISLEIENDQVPVWLWIERAKADIRLAGVSSTDPTVTTTPMKLSIHKAKAKKALIKSALVMFVRTAALVCSACAKQLCESIMEDQEFEFLHDTCFRLIQDILELEEERPPKSLPSPSILEVSFNIREIMSFCIEKEAMESLSDTYKGMLEAPKRPSKKPNPLSNKTSEEVSQLISKQMEELFGKDPEEKITKFIVIKTYNSSPHITKVLQSFSTKEEALEFVKTLETNFPEIRSTCKIEIVKEEE